MTGPEHYIEAERCLFDSGCEYACPHSGCVHEMRMIGRAEAHATLALAAVQALMATTAGVLPEDDCADWEAAVRAS